MQASPALVQRPLTVRSSVTNDPLSIRGVDGRTDEARRFRDLVIAFVDDLGGVAHAGEADKALARQAAAAVVASEKVQARVIAGDVVDLEQLTRLSNVASRCLKQLKVRHKPRRTSNPLAEHFAKPPVREARG